MKKGKYKVYDIFSLLLKPEKCPECEEWKDVHKTWQVTDTGTHESLQRICTNCEDEKILDPFGETK
jgi:hypothetical protein